MKNRWSKEYTLRAGDFDKYDRIMPSAVLDLFQDAAGQHAEEIGVGFADMIARCNSTLFASVAPDVLTTADIDKLIEVFRISSMAKSEAEPMDWMEKTVPEEILWEGNLYKYNWD